MFKCYLVQFAELIVNLLFTILFNRWWGLLYYNPGLDFHTLHSKVTTCLDRLLAADTRGVGYSDGSRDRAPRDGTASYGSVRCECYAGSGSGGAGCGPVEKQ